MRVNINDIVVKKRIRKNLGDIGPLMDSLRRYGQLSPITLDSNNVLIAGQRRLESARRLGWETIEAVMIDRPSKLQSLEMEIEENTQREPFTEADLLNAYAKLERIRNPSFFYRLWIHFIELIKDFINFFRKN